MFGKVGRPRKVVKMVDVKENGMDIAMDQRVQQFKNREEKELAAAVSGFKPELEAKKPEPVPEPDPEPVAVSEMSDDGVYVVSVSMSGKMIKDLHDAMAADGFLSLDEVVRDAVRYYGSG